MLSRARFARAAYRQHAAFGRTYFLKTTLLGTTDDTAQKNVVIVSNYLDYLRSFGLVTNAITCMFSHAPAFGRTPGLRPDTYFLKTKLLGTTDYTAQKNVVIISNYLDYLRSSGLVTNAITCMFSHAPAFGRTPGLRPDTYFF